MLKLTCCDTQTVDCYGKTFVTDIFCDSWWNADPAALKFLKIMLENI